MKHAKAILFMLQFYLLLFFGHGRAYAQSMPPFKKGTDTAAIMRMIRAANPMANIDSSILLLKMAASLSTEAGFHLGAATAMIAAGSRYADRGQYAEALSCANTALTNAEKAGDTVQLAFCYNLFGAIGFYQGDYVHASENYYRSLGIIKKIDSNNYRVVLSVYTNLAAINSRLGQKDKMLLYLNKGEQLARDSSLTHGKAAVLLAGILNNKGNYFERNHAPDSAIKYYNEVLSVISSIDPKSSKRIRFEALSYINLGAALLQLHDYAKAAGYCRQGIALAKEKFSFIATSGSFTLGEALRDMKQYKEAEAVLLQALKEKNGTNTKDDQVLGYASLVKVYRETRQFEKALQYSDTLRDLQDTLTSAEKTKAVRTVEAKYDVAEKDRQIARNELLIAQQKNKIINKNLWILGAAGLVVVLAVILVALYFVSRHKQQGIIRALKQENTINILKGVVQGEENERIRLAKDLHDGIGGMLSATKMRFMALRHENDELVTSSRYLEAMGLLDILGDEIRKTSHNLMPEVLLKQNLEDALNTYCNNLQADTSLRIDFQSFGTFSHLPNDFKLNIYRIVQELLKNAMQHAGATHIVVQIMMLEDYLTINVEDNGKGFNPDETKDGIGLHNLKMRVLSHEGHYTLRSEPGKGTTVCIEFAMARDPEMSSTKNNFTP